MSFTPRKSISRARQLRRAETEAEKRLWGYLRDRRLNGHKFIRQVPVGSFIADFLCRKKRLIVEVDGATHSEQHEITYDERRTSFLAAQGYCIHRVTNADVFTILNDVLDMILMKLENRDGNFRSLRSRPSSDLRPPMLRTGEDGFTKIPTLKPFNNAVL